MTTPQSRAAGENRNLSPLLTLSLILIAPSARAQAKPAAAPDYALGRANAMRFNADIYIWDPSLARARFRNIATLGVIAVRPGALRIDVLRSANSATVTPPRQPTQPPTPHERISYQTYAASDLYISDGKTQYWLTKRNSPYTKPATWYWKTPAKPNLTQLNLSEPLGEACLQWPDILFAADPLAGAYRPWDPKAPPVRFKLAALVNRKGEGARDYVCEQSYGAKGGSVRLTLLVSNKTGLPIRLSEYRKTSAKGWIEDRREEFSKWILNPKAPPFLFDVAPPAFAVPEPWKSKRKQP